LSRVPTPAPPDAGPKSVARPPVAEILLALVFLSLALVPDEKLARHKLLALELGFASFAAAWVLASVWRGRLRVAFTPLLAAVSAWTIWATAGWLASDQPALAATEARRAWIGLAAFWTASQGRGLASSRRLWGAWAAAAGAAAAYGLLQWTGGVGPLRAPRLDRVMGTFGNPIFFGAYLAVSLPLAVGLCASARGRAARALWGACASAAGAALYLTGTRAAWIGAAAAGVTALLLLERRPGRLASWAAAAVVAAGLFAAATRSSWTRDQAHGLIWRDTIGLWRSNPVFGVGPGEFHIHFPAAAGEDLKAKWPSDRFIVNYAHSEPLQVLAETGVAGFLPWALVWVFFFRRAWRAVGGAPPGDPRRVAAASVAAAAAACLAQSFFSVDLRFGVSSAVLFYLLGSLPAGGERVLEASWRPTASRRVALAGAWAVAVGAVCPDRSPSGWRLNVLGAVQAGRGADGWGVRVFPEDMRAGLLTRLLHPYLAHFRRTRAPDFFDVRLLDPVRTIEELESLAARYPDQAAVFEKLGFARAKEMRPGGRGGALDRAMALQAAAAYRKAAELDPTRAGAFNNLGNIHFTLGDQAEALVCWGRAVEADPRQLDARLNLGKVYYLNGRLREAAEQFRKALELNPGNDEATVYLKRMVE
jgi:O-antigen ligase